MRKRALLLALLLAPACGQKQQPPPQAPPAQPQAVQQPEPPQAPPPEPPKDPAKRAAAEAKVRELERSIKDIEERHKQEKLPAAGPLRQAYVQAIRDANDKQRQLETLQERFNELKKLAESAARGKIKELREERAKIQERYDAIQDAWAKSQQEARLGTVEESPVKKDLDTVRAVKAQWFAATPAARRGAAKDSDRKTINDSFRGWLGETPDRKRVVGQVLAQPLGPKGKTPDTYDFTELDFFILLALMEEQLERANIVVEKKELTESRGKLDGIDKELDAVDEKIREQMLAGGEELQEYEELQERIPGVQALASSLAERVVALRDSLKQMDEAKERQAREEEEARVALETARRELAKLR